MSVTAPSANFTRYSGLQVFAAFTALLIGGFIYMIYRTEKLLMFRVAESMGLGERIRAWRDAVTLSLPEWIIYNLPNALWASSFILIVDALLKTGSSRQKLLIASIIPAIGVISELMQFFGFLPGTFDILDVLAYAIPYIIYALIIKTTQK